MEQKVENKFKYNGADLHLMKRLAHTDDPHVAIESFIERALMEMKDPNRLLEEFRKAYPNG